MSVRCLVLSLLLVNVSVAQVYPLRMKVKQCKESCRFVDASGSVVAIDSTSAGTFFLTVGHNIDGARRGTHEVQIGGDWYPTKPLAWGHSQTLDIAVLKLVGEASVPVRTCQLGPQPQPGHRVTCLGFGSGLVPRAGTVLKNRTIGSWITLSCRVRPGDSGGGVFDQVGQLVGIISAIPADGRSETIAASLPAMRSALQSAKVNLAPSRTPIASATVTPSKPNTSPKPNIPSTFATEPSPHPMPSPVANASASTTVITSSQSQQQEIARLQLELETLRKRLAELERRPIAVELVDEAGSVVDRQSYPPGKPIRLQFRTRRVNASKN